MTVALTTAPTRIAPVPGAASVIITNNTAVAVKLTQRFAVVGATEEADPTTDPGFSLATGLSIVLPFGQPIWAATASSTGNIAVVPWGS